MDSLRSLIDRASGYAETLFKRDDVMMPHFIAEDAEGGITIAALALSGSDLDEMRRTMALKFLLDGYRRWVFVSEAWMVEYESGVSKLAPADHPERLEIIQFDALDIAGNRRRRARRQIFRHDNGVRLLPLVFSDLPTVDVPAAGSRSRNAPGGKS